jgi:type VI secretion system protein ImpE
VSEIKHLVESGRLEEAVTALTAAVRANPSDAQARVSLFEVLCVAGEYDRAGKQLEVFSQGGANPEVDLAVQVYRDLLAGERHRAKVFAGEAAPRFLFPPPDYISAALEVVHTLSKSSADAAARLADVEEQTPAYAGRHGETSFTQFRDADDRLAAVLELFHGSDYVWLPLAHIVRIDITPPRRLRELVWVHAHVETYEGSGGDVFLPVRYPGSSAQADPLVRLGQRTLLEAIDDQIVVGRGRRVFLVDDREVSILELGSVEFATAPAGQVSA